MRYLVDEPAVLGDSGWVMVVVVVVVVAVVMMEQSDGEFMRGSHINRTCGAAGHLLGKRFWWALVDRLGSVWGGAC